VLRGFFLLRVWVWVLLRGFVPLRLYILGTLLLLLPRDMMRLASECLRPVLLGLRLLSGAGWLHLAALHAYDAVNLLENGKK
jgi:hypothetical protein